MGPRISYWPAMMSPAFSVGASTPFSIAALGSMTASSGFVGGMNGSWTMPSATEAPERYVPRLLRNVDSASMRERSPESTAFAGLPTGSVCCTVASVSSSSAKGSNSTASVRSSGSLSAKGSNSTASVCSSGSLSAKGSNFTASVRSSGSLSTLLSLLALSSRSLLCIAVRHPSPDLVEFLRFFLGAVLNR